MQSNRGRPLLPMRSRPITLGEILFREESQDMVQPPPRIMSRIMSPTRRLGSLANGRPRRARARTLTRPSTTTSSSTSSDNPDNDSHTTRPGTPSAPQPIPSLLRWRSAATEAYARQVRGLDGPDQPYRRGNSLVTRPRHRSVAGRPEPSGLFINSSGRQRNASAQSGRSRSRSNTNSAWRSGSLHGGPPQRTAPRTMVSRQTLSNSRIIDVYESQVMQGYSLLSSVSSHVRSPGRANVSTVGSAATERDSPNGNSQAEVSPRLTRYINFAAEFIPVNPPPPDAEPPEWSFDITPADFGPFAIGRSAESRATSLAMIAALSQVDESELNNEFNPN